MTHSSGFMPDKGSPMSSNPPHPPLPHPTSHMQYQPHHHLPATPLTPSHSSSAEADGTLSDGGPGDHILGGGGSGPGIPQSVKGAPKHLRPVIRKLQNSASAKRSRQRRKVAAKAFYERFDDQCKRLAALEHKVAALSDLVRKKREMEAAEARRLQAHHGQAGAQAAPHAAMHATHHSAHPSHTAAAGAVGRAPSSAMNMSIESGSQSHGTMRMKAQRRVSAAAVAALHACGLTATGGGGSSQGRVGMESGTPGCASSSGGSANGTASLVAGAMHGSSSAQAQQRQLEQLHLQLRQTLQLQQQMQVQHDGVSGVCIEQSAAADTTGDCQSEQDALLPTDDCRVGEVGQVPLVEPVLHTMAAAAAGVPAGGVGVGDDSHPLTLDEDLHELLDVQSQLLFSPC